MKTTDFLKMTANCTVEKMETVFDTHTFITQIVKDFEKEYVELLYKYIDSPGIFKTLHGQIGLYLNDNQDYLSIEKLDKIKSDNIKDYKSMNQKWKKLS